MQLWSHVLYKSSVATSLYLTHTINIGNNNIGNTMQIKHSSDSTKEDRQYQKAMETLKVMDIILHCSFIL